VFRGRHKAKRSFAVCPILCTRQTYAHTANYHLPVVKLDGGRGKIVGTPGGYAEGFVEKSFSFWV